MVDLNLQVGLNLRDVQGNILLGYRKLPAVAHLFGRIDERDVAKWRSFFEKLGPRLTLAQWDSEPASTVNLGLSQRALARLQPAVAGEIAARFSAFAEGMPSRARELGDGAEFDRKWQERDVWLSIHAADTTGVRSAVDELKKSSEVPLSDEGPYGEALLKAGRRFEHFGFRDDISWPAVEGTPTMTPDEVKGRGKFDEQSKTWSTIATGEFLLGHKNELDQNPLDGLSDAARRVLENATFGVLRRLQQDVVRFRRYLKAEHGGLGEELLASRMVGRLRDGTPLAKSDGLADFTYAGDEKGARCPVGAHVRRVNPRTDGRHRLIRRGITYGPELAEGTEDTADRGLWFVAFNASIEDQFEFIQKQWINASFGTGVGSLGQTFDPIAGSGGSRAFVINGDTDSGREPRLFFDIPQFVTCRGGQYYLVPSRTGLEALVTQ